MIFRMLYRRIPFAPHVHCALFVAPSPAETFALCGTFTVRAGEEFAAMQDAFTKVEFIEENGRGDEQAT